jgi:divalent metal cation (Fe/Co/Zn/Cd) transporter
MMQAAKVLVSPTLAADARNSLGCIHLSSILFAGNLLYLLVQAAWFVDPIASIVMGLIIARDGFGAVISSFKADFAGGRQCCA